MASSAWTRCWGVCWGDVSAWDSRFAPHLRCSPALSCAAWEGLRGRAGCVAGWDPREPQWRGQNCTDRGGTRLKRLSSTSAWKDTSNGMAGCALLLVQRPSELVQNCGLFLCPEAFHLKIIHCLVDLRKQGSVTFPVENLDLVKCLAVFFAAL